MITYAIIIFGLYLILENLYYSCYKNFFVDEDDLGQGHCDDPMYLSVLKVDKLDQIIEDE